MSEEIAVENQWVPLNLKSVTGDLKKIRQIFSGSYKSI